MASRRDDMVGAPVSRRRWEAVLLVLSGIVCAHIRLGRRSPRLPGPWQGRRVLAGRRRPLGSEDPVEDAGELGVPVPDEEAEGADPVAEVHEQVAGLLCGPCAVRVRGDLEDVHAPGRHLHDEQHVQYRRLRKIVST